MGNDISLLLWGRELLFETTILADAMIGVLIEYEVVDAVCLTPYLPAPFVLTAYAPSSSPPNFLAAVNTVAGWLDQRLAVASPT